MSGPQALAESIFGPYWSQLTAVNQQRIAASTVSQQQSAAATINGIPTYTLGAAQEAILKASPALEAGIGSFFGELELSYQNFSGRGTRCRQRSAVGTEYLRVGQRG